MTLPDDATISAVAIATGVGIHTIESADINSMGWGFVELFVEIAAIAGASAALVAAVTERFDDLSFPGVYAYEVDEAVGEFIAQRIKDRTYKREAVIQNLKGHAAEFFLPGSMEAARFILSWECTP